MEGFAPGWKLLALLSLDGRIEVVANASHGRVPLTCEYRPSGSLGVEAVE